MTDVNIAKREAARSAAALVEGGMKVGLGSGSTASLVIQYLGERVHEQGLKFLGVPTSVATAELAHSFAIPLRDVDDVDQLDLDIDGADEVDPRFRMIKGRGGALLREKIVACASRKRVIVVTAEKRVQRLGMTAPVPVEVSPIGTRHVEAHIRRLGAVTTLRRHPDGTPYRTDGGNQIIDCRFEGIDDPHALHISLKSIVGLYETGLFLGLCDLLVVGQASGVELVVCPPDESRIACPS